MMEAGLQDVDTYNSRLKKKVTQFIATRPIMGLCLAVERRSGIWISKRWWEQDGMDVEGIWTAAREVERTEGDEETDGAETEAD